MKINRFIALAVIALLVVGVMGAVSMKVFALGSTTNTPVATSVCAQDQTDGTELPSATETDKVDTECSDEHGSGAQGIEEAPGTEQAGEHHHHDENGTAEALGTDNGNEQAGDQNGPDGKEAVDAPNTNKDNEKSDNQNASDNGTETPEIQATATP